MPLPNFSYYDRPTKEKASIAADIGRAVAFIHRYRVRYGASTEVALLTLEHHHRELIDPNTDFSTLRAIFLGQPGAV